MKQYKHGAILSYINIILTIGIGFFITPFIVGSLGDSEYGLYSLIGSTVAYLSIMDLGLNNTIIRFVSKYRAENNLEEEQKFLGNTMYIYGLISLVVLLLGIVLYFKLPSLFSKSLSGKELAQAQIMFLILLFNMVIALPGGSFTAICNACEEFSFPRALSIIKYILRTIMIISVLTMGGKAISLVIIDTVMNILVIIVSMYYVLRKLKVKFYFPPFAFENFQPIFSYSFWLFITALTQIIQWNSGQVILGMTSSTSEITIFAIGIMLGTYYGAFAGVINSLLLPKASQMISRGTSNDKLSNTAIEIARLINVFSFLIIGGFCIFGSNFIHLWVTPLYNKSGTIALIIMSGLCLTYSLGFCQSIIEGKNKVRFRSISQTLMSIFGIILAYYLSKTMGGLGIAIGISSAIVMNFIFMILYFKRIFDFNIFKYIKQSLFKPLIFATTITLTYFQIYSNLQSLNWWNISIHIFCFSLLYLAGSYFFLLNPLLKNHKF